MIHFNLNLSNPFWTERFANIKNWRGRTFFKNKFWEFEILKNDDLIRLEFGFTTQQDHAGLNINLGIFGFEIHASIYDCRHWDYHEKRWLDYNPEDKGELL